MARSRTTKSTKLTTPDKVVDEISQEEILENPKEEIAETPEEKVAADPKAPVNIELSASEEPKTPAPAAPPEKIQTDVRAKLAKKSLDENIFVPANPAALEKAAAQVAEEGGFVLNRGTSIGARLIARAQKRV
jgi:hypothetical protein